MNWTRDLLLTWRQELSLRYALLEELVALFSWLKRYRYEQFCQTSPPTPALDLWQVRIAKGVDSQRADRHSTWILDSLWEAACYEATALEHHGSGGFGSALWCLSRARELVA